MNSKHIFASAAVASILALTSPANAQVLGGGLSGGVGGALSGGLDGIGGIGAMTSTATSTIRDANSIARASTQHAHDAVSATTDATDRAAANVDKQLESSKAAVDATANAASSTASSVDTDTAQSKVGELKKPAPQASEPVKTESMQEPSVTTSIGASVSGQSNASVER